MSGPSPTGADRSIRLERFFSYPKQVIYLLVSFLTLISLVHFISLAQKYARARRVPRRSAIWYRIPKAIVDSLRAILFRWSVPVPFGYSLNIAEVGLTIGYLGVLLTWTFVNTTTVTGIKVEPHYFANRAGTIAASQLPLITALGMRNNLVSWLTGVSYDKLNYLHRIAFRSLIILIWIHAGGRMTVGLDDDEALVNRWVQCGLLAATTLVVMSILTLRPLRKLSYEVFLVIHFVLAFIFLLSVYFHLTGRDLTYYGAWPAMIVWGLDRFIRLVKLSLFSFSSFFSHRQSSSSSSSSSSNKGYNTNTNARIEILPAANTHLSPKPTHSHTHNIGTETFLKITLTLPYSPLHSLPIIRWRAGQSVYLSIPSLGLSRWPFEAHPFTIANVYRSRGGDNSDNNGDVEKGTAGANDGTETTAAGLNLVFFVRVREGFTRRLFEAVQSSSSSSPANINVSQQAQVSSTPAPGWKTNVILNGPYSAPPLLVGYKRVVLIAGGSGVAFTLPLLLDLIEKSRNPKNTGCRRVLFIWAVRDPAQLSWITPLLQTTLSNLSNLSNLSSSSSSSSSSNNLEIDIRFYITSSPAGSSNSGSPSGSSTPPTPPTPHTPTTPDPDQGSRSFDIEKHSASITTDSDSDSDKLALTSPLGSLTSDTVNISTTKGRPDIGKILGGEISGYHDVDLNGGDGDSEGAGGGTGTGGVVSVNVCGPTALIESTRAALRIPRFLEVVRGAPSVVLHVESFGGA